MRQVADDVYSLGTRGHNFYLLVDGDDVTVIDAESVREWSRLDAGLAANGLHVDQVAGFMITHVHGDRGILFTGDGLITMDLLGTGKDPQMIRDVFNVDSEQAMASLDRIVGLDASTLLPGHGGPWSGSPVDAVALVRS